MNGELKNVFLQRVFERDREEFALGDTLDIKTSIILVVLTFLATQTAGFVAAPGGRSILEISLLSLAIGFLILGTVAAIAELMPRDYDREATPEKYDQWLSELQEYNSEEPDPSSAAIGQAIAGRAEMAKERIQNNLAFNKQKSRLMMISFIAAAIALAVNLGIMITRLF